MGTDGMPRFCADPKIFFKDTFTSSYPEYFSNRTFDRFIVSLYSYGKNREAAEKAYGMTVKYCENIERIIDEYGGGGLYYYSKERGTGKTFLSTILGNELSRKRQRVRWFNMTNLIQDIKAGFDRERETSSADVIDQARNANILILDDIGVEKQSAWLNETVYTILDHRMSKAMPTIFTSNLLPEELGYDERIIDRITRMSTIIRMPEESIRRKMNQRNRLSTLLDPQEE